MLSLNYHAPISNDQIGDAQNVTSFREHSLLNMYLSYFYSTNIFSHKTDTHIIYTNSGAAGSANRAPEIHKNNKQIYRNATVHQI
jgi:hypothetical protein